MQMSYILQWLAIFISNSQLWHLPASTFSTNITRVKFFHTYSSWAELGTMMQSLPICVPKTTKKKTLGKTVLKSYLKKKKKKCFKVPLWPNKKKQDPLLFPPLNKPSVLDFFWAYSLPCCVARFLCPACLHFVSWSKDEILEYNILNLGSRTISNIKDKTNKIKNKKSRTNKSKNKQNQDQTNKTKTTQHFHH